MSSPKTTAFGALGLSLAPKRETLRQVRARTKPAGRRKDVRPRFVLASASPRRLMLLSQIGLEPDGLRPASIDETPRRAEMPRSYVARLARAKAEAARDLISNDEELADAFVLAADTAVTHGRSIFGKPKNVDEALAMLLRLSGRSHRVLTSVCLITPDDRVRLKVIVTRVRFKRLSNDDIQSYLASREWRGKAGGYAIQGIAGSFVQDLSGSYTNVVGLPLTEVSSMLLGEGFPVHFNWLNAGEAEPE